ncbi:MAG: YceD family protein [Chitinophagales bacterium]
MKETREFRIPFIGLKTGVHHFNFEVTDTFFAHYPDSLIKQGKIFADIHFDKKERLFILNFDISGSITTDCDVCGQKFQLPIHGNHTQFVKIGTVPEEAEKSDEDVIWLPESESILDLSDMLYEFIHLSLPIRHLHPNKPDGTPECDPEIIKLLDSTRQEQVNPDPRWAALKNFHKD